MNLKFRSFLLACTSIFCNFLYSAPLQIDNALDFCILDQFFRTMVHQSEYGYVLSHSKPISAINISSLESLPAPQSPWFALGTCSLEAIDVWKRLHPNQSDIVLKVTKMFDSVSNTTEHEILFINKNKLKETLESNIDLFRYVLGSSLDVDRLLVHIIESPESLCSILHDDKVLEGIVLGFGVYNSLMHSRMEALNSTLIRADVPPLSMQCDLMHENMNTLRSRAFFLSTVNSATSSASCISKPIQPGFGFVSTKDELDFINSQTLDLPSTLQNEKPQFVFNSYKNAENFHLIDDLQIIQKQIQSYLDRPDFLEYILEKITGERPVINCSLNRNACFVLTGNIEQAVAKVIWNTYSQLDQFAIPEFIKAFCKRDPYDQQTAKLNLMPGSLPGLKRAQCNLKFAEDQLALCSQKKHLEQVIPHQLYFERLIIGSGEAVDSSGELLLNCTIEDGKGNVLSAYHNSWIKMSETIPGFILGIKGMKEGEMRRIYIHPAYAYGISTTLPPCTFLIANVTLHKFKSHSTGILPSLDPIDLAWLKDPGIYKEFEQSSVQLARSLGSMWGSWLANSRDLNFSKLCQELWNVAQQSKAQLSIDEQRFCNHIFWNLCFTARFSNHDSIVLR